MATKAQINTLQALDSKQIRSTDKSKILDLLNEKCMTLDEIVAILFKRKGTISGRCSELEKEGLIEIIGTRESNGIPQSIYAVTEKSRIAFKRETYHRKRASQLCKTLIRDYMDFLPPNITITINEQ